MNVFIGIIISDYVNVVLHKDVKTMKIHHAINKNILN